MHSSKCWIIERLCPIMHILVVSVILASANISILYNESNKKAYLSIGNMLNTTDLDLHQVSILAFMYRHYEELMTVLAMTEDAHLVGSLTNYDIRTPFAMNKTHLTLGPEIFIEQSCSLVDVIDRSQYFIGTTTFGIHKSLNKQLRRKLRKAIHNEQFNRGVFKRTSKYLKRSS